MACKVRKTLLITTPILSRGTPELIKKVSFDLKAQRCNASYAKKKYKRAPIVTDRYRTTYWKYLNMDFLFKFDDNKDNSDMPSWDAPLL